MKILTINCGSSTLKFELFDVSDKERSLARGIVDRIGGRGSVELTGQEGAQTVRVAAVADHGEAGQRAIRSLDSSGLLEGIEAVGHRVVHGGARFLGPLLLDAGVEETIEELAGLAPLHNGPALAAIRAVRKALGPGVPQVACFDTAFHNRMPRVARLFALPRRFLEEGILRYGFHGLSYEYVMGELRVLDPDDFAGRVVIAHLGNGASMVAVRNGESIDTTMGFTPAGGLVMGTRPGDLDPGVLLHLLLSRGMTPAALSELVNRQAGLLGVSGASADMRDLLEREADDPRAAEAVALFCYQAKKFLGALVAALGGLDTLVFTGGIGEHAATVRESICEGLEFLGVGLDPERNARHAPIISRDDAAVTVRVVPTDEDLMIARHTRELVGLTTKERKMHDSSAYRFDAGVSSAIESDGAPTPVHEEPVEGPLSAELLDRMQRYWQAANYLTIGQIYLKDNPLLREPLDASHIKPRLLGHWGTSPGLSLVYVHLNRLIRERDTDVIFLAGPGHGGPAVLANVYLEGTYSEVYPEVSQDVGGMRRLFRQFSTPGGVPSHVSVPTPGSIHEGGELGYVLTHAFGAAFDNPDLVVCAVVGDGEAETAPLEGSWKSTSFLNPARDGAVLPMLHLNGYKISGPTVLGRASDEEVRSLLEGHGYEVRFVEGDDPARVHQAFAATLDTCYEEIRAIQRRARESGVSERPRWPAIVLRTPKGWTGPGEVGGLPVEGTFRSHQVPLSGVNSDPDQLALLEEWMRSYHPEELFDGEGRLIPELAALAPEGERRMGASPHANGGRVLKDLDLPDFRDYALDVPAPAMVRHESTRRLGEMLRNTFARNASSANFRLFCPDETNSNRLGAVFEVEDRCFVGKTLPIDDHVAPSGRVMEVLSEHLCEGWLEGYLLTGRHGLFATYEAFAMIPASMIVQHTKWLEEATNLPWREPISSLNILLTSTAWRNDHNGFSHQGPGLIDVMLSKRGTVARIYLPADANTLLSVADHCLRSRNYVNLIAIDKQPQLQWLDMDQAIEHAARGASVWDWASNVEEGEEPDVVLACAGDIPTLETVAAAHWLKENAPELRVRVVNVVDLMTLFPREYHPHGMSETRFVELFTASKQVVFAFHGYRRAIHEIVHGHIDVDRFHVRGFSEQGTTTTPFDMVLLNGMSRYHLAMDALKCTDPGCRARDSAPTLISELEALISRARSYSREHLEDPPEIRDWVWTP